MSGKLLERCFVNIILERLLEEIKKDTPLFASQGEFAEKAFPKENNPEKIWQYLKNGQKGKPRSVTIEDAHAMANALNEKLDRLLVKAEIHIEEGWNLADDVFNKEEEKKSGRPKKDKNAQKNEHLAIPLASPELQPPENGATN